MKVFATLITRDGFRKREILSEVRRHIEVLRLPKISPGFATGHPPDLATCSLERTVFYLEKTEGGPNGVIYATYKEL